jgi:hypothetical protein
VREAIANRYQAELATLERLKSAYEQIASYAKGLRLSDLSPSTPARRFFDARQDYQATLAKARTGDAAALGDLTGAADSYLKESRTYYGASKPYQNIYGRVSADLSAVTAQGGSVQTAIDNVKKTAVSKLDGLDARIGNQLQTTGDALAAGIANVADLLNGPNGSLASALKDFIQFATGATATSGSVAAGAANIQGQAATAIASAPTSAVAPVTTTDAGRAQAGGFKMAFEAASKGFNDDDRKRLQKWLNTRLTGQGYTTADWSLWRDIGLQVESLSQSMAAKGKPGHSQQAHILAGDINSRLPQDLRFFATGGLASGWAVVGEHGPELANFSDPARIYTASQTAQALSQLQQPGQQGGDSRLAAAIERLVQIMESGDTRSTARMVAALDRLLAAVQDGHAVADGAADRVERAVRMGLSKRAA